MLDMPIEGRGRHLDPKQIPPKDRDMHLLEFKFCSDINPQQTLGQAHNQNQPRIQRPQKRSLRGTSQNNKVTLLVILYTSWSRGNNIQSVHHNSSIKLARRPHAQSAPTSY